MEKSERGTERSSFRPPSCIALVTGSSLPLEIASAGILRKMSPSLWSFLCLLGLHGAGGSVIKNLPANAGDTGIPG